MQAGSDGAAFAPAVAEVDWDQGYSGGTELWLRRWRERPGETSERPAVGGHERVMAAIVGQSWRTGDALGDRPGEAAAGVDFAPGGDGRD